MPVGSRDGGRCRPLPCAKPCPRPLPIARRVRLGATSVGETEGTPHMGGDLSVPAIMKFKSERMPARPATQTAALRHVRFGSEAAMPKLNQEKAKRPFAKSYERSGRNRNAPTLPLPTVTNPSPRRISFARRRKNPRCRAQSRS